MAAKPTYEELEQRIKELEKEAAICKQRDNALCKNAQEVVRVSEQEYRSTLNNLLVGVVVHAFDTSILLSNPEATNILGLTFEQMSGKKAIDPSWNFVHADSTVMKVEDYPVSKVFSTEKPLYDYVLGVNRPDRDYITWVIVNAIPVFSNDDQLVKVIVNFIDITARKRAEEALLESSEFREKILSELPIGITIYDTVSGQCVAANGAMGEFIGASKKQVLEQNFYGIESWKKSGLLKTAKNALRDNSNKHQEIIVTTTFGIDLWGDCYFAPFLAGGKKYLLFTLSDISERKKGEQFVESINKVNHAILREQNLERLLGKVMTLMLDIFDCDRAWLLYPCDPDIETCKIPVQRTKAEWPAPEGLEIKIDEHAAYVMGTSLESDSPVAFYASKEPKVSKNSEKNFFVKSQLVQAIHPYFDKSWLFGMHQCSHERIWTNHEKELFGQISIRLRDALNNLLFYKKLQKSEEKYRTLIESMQDGVFIIQGSEIIFTNDAFANMFGYSIDKMPHMTFTDLIAPEDLEKVTGTYGHSQARKTLQAYEWRMLHKDGSRVWVSMTMGTIDLHGQLASMGTVKDITVSKAAEKELKHLRNYLSNIIDSMPSILVGVDLDGNVTQWNSEAQQTTGLSVKDAVGQPLIQVFPRLALEMNRVREAITNRVEQSHMKNSRKEDGEIRYEDVTVYPLIANGVEGAVIRVDDVTERVRIEEMVVQSEKMLSVGGLAAGMAHEINNPLGGMMQTAEVLSNRLTRDDLPANIKAAAEVGITMEAIKAFMEKRKIIDMLARIRESGSRAAKIVANMLSFARKSDSSWSSQNMADLLDQCVELAGSDYNLKKKYDFRQIRIFREYEEAIPLVPCESGKIQQVLLNLLRNGAEAVQEESEGRIKKAPCFVLRLAHEGETGMVRIEIEDNGPGMKEEIRRRVFDPFFTTKSTDRGTGLGLSVSYFIITENHKGEMSVESTPGEGTKFIIGLPVKNKPEANSTTGGYL